jgi:hypothetical protein
MERNDCPGVILAKQIGALGGQPLVMQEMIQRFEIDDRRVPGKIEHTAKENERGREPIRSHPCGFKEKPAHRPTQSTINDV